MFQKRHPPAGASPGTLVIPPDAVEPRITAIRYTPEDVEQREIRGPAEIEPLRRQGGILWVDVQGLGSAETLQAIGGLFDLHPLALEDIVNIPARPKTEHYEDHQLYVSRMVELNEKKAIAFDQMSIFFGQGYVLTFQERYGDVLDPVRERIRRGKGTMRRSGADYLAYAIIDTIIDHYFPALDIVSDSLEALKARVLERPTRRTLADLNRIKRTLLDLRRGIWPQRDAVNALVRGDSPFVTEPVRLFLRDTYDHAVQVTEVIEMYREMTTDLFNTHLSVVNNRMNEVMKVLTIMSSIFIPLTFVVGVYGMNFDFMPELRLRWGYPAVLGVMALSAGALLWYFRRKGWLERENVDKDA